MTLWVKKETIYWKGSQGIGFKIKLKQKARNTHKIGVAGSCDGWSSRVWGRHNSFCWGCYISAVLSGKILCIHRVHRVWLIFFQEWSHKCEGVKCEDHEGFNRQFWVGWLHILIIWVVTDDDRLMNPVQACNSPELLGHVIHSCTFLFLEGHHRDKALKVLRYENFTKLPLPIKGNCMIWNIH